MKVTLRYEESEDKERHMTLRLTLPKKYCTGACKEVVRLFVEHYNKKHTESPLDACELHLKVAGGNHLKPDTIVEDFVEHGDECYLLGGEATDVVAFAPKRPAPAPVKPAEPAKVDEVKKDSGLVRCKNFGCQKMFNLEGEPQECQHHKAAPIFHETAKWWSCCPDNKAYDFDEFMKIPGCQRGTCSRDTMGQTKRALGGCDLRAASAPVRLDADAPKDPRHKLGDLRAGLVAIGVNQDLIENVYGKVANESGGDVEKVVETFRARFERALSK